VFAFAAVWLTTLAIPAVLQADPRTPLRSRTDPSRARPAPQVTSDRVADGLIAYYPLLLSAGETLVDRGPVANRLNLRTSGAVRWLDERNGIALDSSPDNPALAQRRGSESLREALVATGTFSVEVWVRGAQIEQGGPARIVTLSPNPWQRNFMLGIEGEDVRVRLRTTETGDNGTPDIRFKGAASSELEHYVVTFSGGTVALYRNGQLFGAEPRGGDLSNWDPGYTLLFGNEVEGERPWIGELYTAAIYDRGLSDEEIARNFAAGSNPAASTGGTNRAPLVDAGPERLLIRPESLVNLAGYALDDGLPSGSLDVGWRMIEGPVEVEWDDASEPYGVARFRAPGEYRLELRASDGAATSVSETTVRVVATSRVEQDLLAFYSLTEDTGETAADHSGAAAAPALELVEGARWLSGGNGVYLPEEGRLQSAEGAEDLRHALVARNAFTFEVWAQPANLAQSETTLLSFSQRSYREKNFAMAQDREGLMAYLRTAETKDNGQPSLRARETFEAGLAQYAATWDGEMLRLYRNGEEMEARPRVGNLDEWNPELPLVIGAEGDGHHGWSGEVHLVAIYGRPLNEVELRRNYLSGGREIAIGGSPAANQAPYAEAGDNRMTSLPNDVIRLRGQAMDDGLPGAMGVEWTQVSGPADAAFESRNLLEPVVRLTAPGDYVFELAANDGQFILRDQVEVTVLPESHARLLDHATWGPTPELIERLKTVGPEAFVEEQFAARPSEFREDDIGGLRPVQDRFFYHALYGEDQLRQRMMFALSKILVVSANTVGRRDQMVPYLRLLNDHAFGNYYDLIREVTLSPTMGEYLDMVNNAAQDEEYPEPPNENYARELLQLLTIGTELLNPDGTAQTGPDGEPLPAYSEEDVREFTRALTGWTYPTRPNGTLHWTNYDYYEGRMEAVEERHDSGPKTLLNGTTLPAGQPARKDLEDALRNIFEHPNMGPFIGKQLIQQLVSSNPSPGYVERVAAAFDDNGEGERGDLKAVLRAILLDLEAAASTPTGGHLREPILFSLTLLRALGAQATPDSHLNEYGQQMGQWVFYPPSIFSYFSPKFRTQSGVLGPEFQIFTKGNALERANFVDEVVRNDLNYGVSIEFDWLEDMADEPDRVLDAIDGMLFQGRMTGEVRETMRRAMAGLEEPRDRIRNAIYVAATSAEYQVEH